MLELGLQAAGFLSRISANQEGYTGWQEFQNKLQAFYLFEHIDSVLGISLQKALALPELLKEASSLGPYYSVWATEGLGRYYADLSLQSGTFPSGLFCNAQSHALPDSSMVPLHAGMGLSFAEFMLSRKADYIHAVESFIQACLSNSREGYVEVAYEALGLVTRNLYPRLLGPIHDCLLRYRPEIADYFWHGVGRATYFSPRNFLPIRNSVTAGMEMIISDSPAGHPRRNALAGFAWALTLVNIRHPEIMAAVLQLHGNHMPDPEAFKNGVYSSLIVWRNSSPLDSNIDRFCNYKSADSVTKQWIEYMRGPCSMALHTHQSIKASHNIGKVFRF